MTTNLRRVTTPALYHAPTVTEMEDARTELARRRERGRMAQSAFRKRQAQAQEEMRRENAALKQAIQAIAAEACPEEYRGLKSRIREAAKLAGVVGAEVPKVATDRSTDSPTDDSSTLQVSDNAVASLRKDDASLSERRNLYHHIIYHDPFQQCEHSTDWLSIALPFLGVGAFTVAGRIFWNLVETVDATDNESSALKLHRPRLGLSAVLHFRDLLDRSIRAEKLEPADWISLLEAQVAANMAYVPQNKLPSAPPTWLSPLAAETRLRAVLGDSVFTVLAAPTTNCWEWNTADPAKQKKKEVIDDFLQLLSQSHVCTNQGPRWEVSMFDQVLKTWSISVISDYTSG